MAEESKQEKKPEKKIIERKVEVEESLVRILSTDVPGKKNIITGLTWIKGVSWSVSNAICSILKLDPKKKVSALTKEEIEKISEFLKKPSKMPEFLMNRRRDIETGENSHLIGTDLDLQKEFDIKRLKKIRSYKGWRHATAQPVRGQRTKSHFRKKGRKKAVGVRSKGGKK
jgi:small subunit ribosomal protein S13